MNARLALASLLAIFAPAPAVRSRPMISAQITREDEHELSPEASQRIAFSLRKFFRGIGRG